MEPKATVADILQPPLRTNDLVARFGIPEPTWRGWRHEGKGPRWYKLGGIVMYDQSDIQAWVEEQKASTGKGVV